MSDTGMPDLSGLLQGAMQMQQNLAAAQQAAADTVVEGASGGGVVKVTVTGAMDFQSVRIDPSAVDPSDVSMLEDLVLAAVRDAAAKAGALSAQATQSALGGGLGGLDLGRLLGQ